MTHEAHQWCTSVLFLPRKPRTKLRLSSPTTLDPWTAVVLPGPGQCCGMFDVWVESPTQRRLLAYFWGDKTALPWSFHPSFEHVVWEAMSLPSTEGMLRLMKEVPTSGPSDVFLNYDPGSVPPLGPETLLSADVYMNLSESDSESSADTVPVVIIGRRRVVGSDDKHWKRDLPSSPATLVSRATFLLSCVTLNPLTPSFACPSPEAIAALSPQDLDEVIRWCINHMIHLHYDAPAPRCLRELKQ